MAEHRVNIFGQLHIVDVGLPTRCAEQSSPDAAEALDGLPATRLPATRLARQATDVVSGRVGGAQQNESPLSNLLQAQANMMQNSICKRGTCRRFRPAAFRRGVASVYTTVEPLWSEGRRPHWLR